MDNTSEDLLSKIWDVYGIAPISPPINIQILKEKGMIAVSPWDIDHYSQKDRTTMVCAWLKRGQIGEDGRVYLASSDRYFLGDIKQDLIPDEDEYFDLAFQEYLDLEEQMLGFAQVDPPDYI